MISAHLMNSFAHEKLKNKKAKLLFTTTISVSSCNTIMTFRFPLTLFDITCFQLVWKYQPQSFELWPE